MSQKTTDLIKQTVAMLTALAPVAALFGFNPEFLTPDSIEQFGVLVGAIIALGITLYGIYMNTYTQWKAFRLADEKKRQRLAEESKVK